MDTPLRKSKCPVCGSDDFARVAFEREELPFNECENCSSVFTNGKPDLSKIDLSGVVFDADGLLYEPSEDYLNDDGKYKTIGLCTIPFIEDLPTVLGEVHSLLQDGGTLVVHQIFRSGRDFDALSKHPDFKDGSISIPSTEGLDIAAKSAGFIAEGSTDPQTFIFRKA